MQTVSAEPLTAGDTVEHPDLGVGHIKTIEYQPFGGTARRAEVRFERGWGFSERVLDVADLRKVRQ